jgi:hypothetical protein
MVHPLYPHTYILRPENNSNDLRNASLEHFRCKNPVRRVFCRQKIWLEWFWKRRRPTGGLSQERSLLELLTRIHGATHLFR